MIPGLFDGRNKAFYFFHYEQLRFPNSFTRTRTVLNPRAVNGTFRYLVGSEEREQNVLSLAAANGQISAVDPTVARLLANIQASTATSGTRRPVEHPLLDVVRLAEPGHAVRAPADAARRLQPQRPAPAQRVVPR